MASIGGQQPSGSSGSSDNRRASSILDCKAISGLDKLQGGSNFVIWANRFRKVIDQYRPFGREAIRFLENQSLETVETTLRNL